MKIYFTWDDGAPEDLRLFELHEKFEIPGMFFVPTRNREGRKVLTPDELRRSESAFVSFGGHTANHVYLNTVSIDEAEAEIIDNQKYLEDTLGHEVRHFCLPGGKYNSNILDIAFKHFETVRTTNTMCFRGGDSLVKPSFHVYPRGIKSLAANALIRNRSFGDFFRVIGMSRMDYFDIIKEFLQHKSKDDSQVVFWGHSWEIEELGLWEKLEGLFGELKKEYADCLCSYDEIEG